MVTYSSPSVTSDKTKYSFEGLSTDTKPTATDYSDLANGSTFLEMDTQTLYFYDEESDVWI